MENTTMTRTGVSAWAPAGVLCVAPNAQLQGSGLPFAAPVPAYVITDGMGLSVAKGRHTADAKVPDPRGRHR